MRHNETSPYVAKNCDCQVTTHAVLVTKSGRTMVVQKCKRSKYIVYRAIPALMVEHPEHWDTSQIVIARARNSGDIIDFIVKVWNAL